MKLNYFIRAIGINGAADLFGAKQATVKTWLYGYRQPSPDQALNIQRKTKGHEIGEVLTIADIYELPTLSRRASPSPTE